MLPRKILVKKTRWVWIAFLILSPLAYLAGAYLIFKYDPNAQVGFSIDREQALAITSRYAAAKGANVSGWQSFLKFKPDNNLLFYYRYRSGAERDLARGLAPEAAVGVLYRSPDHKETIEILITPDGRLLGFKRNISKSIQVTDAGEEASRKVAEEAVKARLAAVGANQPVELKPAEQAGEEGVREYTWRWSTPGSPELTLVSNLGVRGGVLVRDEIEAQVDKDYANQHLHAKQTGKIISVVIFGLVVAIVIIFGLYRFVQRAQQKEVSYSRSFILTFFIAAIMSGFIMITDVAIYGVAQNPEFPAPDWVIYFSSSMFYVLVGIFLGLAYGSGEGDIREAYPGKLTSLDALMTGRIFSRNVARSTISGWAFGGWMLFLINLVVIPWQSVPSSGEELGPLDAWLGKAPWLFSLTIWPTDVVLVVVIGLLIPLPFLHRRFGSSRFVYLILFFFIFIACSGPYLTFRPVTAMFGMALVRTLLTMLAFFQFDLLTVIIAVASPTFVAFSISLMAQPSLTMRQYGIVSLAIAVLVLLVEFFFAFKGRTYKEAEVRPLYAGHLAERLSMQAEVTAAREAQKRLMSSELPRNASFSVAASCLPAYEVGGDFYDIFELQPGKLGVLIAEGGGKGLGSALSIAFAKGFLMPKILGETSADNSPSEIIRALQDRLMTQLDEDAGVGIAFAVIDANDGILRYARTGTHPLILVAQQDSALKQPEERVLRFKSNLGADADVCITEGMGTIDPGGSVVLFTDGIAKNLTDNKTSPEHEFAEVLEDSRGESPGDLQNSLLQKVNQCSKRSRKMGLEDDLTAVIIRLKKENRQD